MMEEGKEPEKAPEPSTAQESAQPREQQQQQQASSSTPQTDGPTLARARQLLKSRSDTARFVGLALLRAFLDNSAELRSDEGILVELWRSVPGKFLDRLVRTGLGSSTASAAQDDDNEAAKEKRANGKDMLDLAVSVIHKFVSLLPDEEKQSVRLLDRMPMLMAALLKSSPDTTKLILQIFVSLTTSPEGVNAFAQLDDMSPLIEVAPQHPEALDVLCNAWLGIASLPLDEVDEQLSTMIDDGLLRLCLLFKGTDAVTFLAFVGRVLRGLDSQFLPASPKWLGQLVTFIHNLVSKRPNAEARNAYTTAAAALLLAYPSQAGPLMFTHDSAASEKPVSYLLMNLLLIDIRSTIPVLLESLNSPAYAPVSYRLTCAFDVVSSFTGFLVRCMDDESDAPLPMAPDLLLKLRKAVGETMSVSIEYLRDRWDAAHAGAMGLHPDARSSATHTPSGVSRLPLAWDSATGDVIEEDVLVLAALRALALWVREDDGDMLRREASGLCDMLLELYQTSILPLNTVRNPKQLDFRSPVLITLEALSSNEDGIEIVLKHDAWAILTKDLMDILDLTSVCNDEAEALRGTEIVRVLLLIVEDAGSTTEEWMGLITTVAAWVYPDTASGVGGSEIVTEFHVAVLQLVCALVVDAHPGMRRRYVHSVAAARGIAGMVASKIVSSSPLLEGIQDVVNTLGAI
jgi:hypothetical protein